VDASKLNSGWFVVGVTLALFRVVSTPQLMAQDSLDLNCNDSSVLDRAGAYYDVGMFDRVLGTLQPCLPHGLDEKEQKIGVYRLMALSYIATDSLDQARESVRALLKTDSGYKADALVDPPLFVDLIEAEQPPWYTFMWEGSSAGRWVGRAVVIGTAVAVPLLLRDTNEPPLPGPPDLPETFAQ
jgi:hypothetical protein